MCALTQQHIPVLKGEAIQALRIDPAGVYIDATFGRGGHTAEIIERLNSNGQLFVIDRDLEACRVARQRYADDARVTVIHSDFGALANLGIPTESINGILFDLGVSSPQLDDAERGFSFMRDGALDMRMDASQGVSAAHWLQEVSEADLVQVLFDFGEEKFARRIARQIVAERETAPITTTLQLAEIVRTATPKIDKHKHPATRTFQAIRLHINSELEQVRMALPAAVKLLAPAGRLVVISFHSLEDRIVKRFMRSYANPKLPPKSVPTSPSDYETPLTLVTKATKPSQDEVAANARARSSILRVAERTSMTFSRLAQWEANHAR